MCSGLLATFEILNYITVSFSDCKNFVYWEKEEIGRENRKLCFEVLELLQ